MSTPSRNKRKLDDVIAITQEEYENTLARRQKGVLLQVQEYEIKMEEEAGQIDAVANDGNSILHHRFTSPSKAAVFNALKNAARDLSTRRITPERYNIIVAHQQSEWQRLVRYHGAEHRNVFEIAHAAYQQFSNHQVGGNHNAAAHIPNINTNQKIQEQDQFEAKFVAHQQNPSHQAGGYLNADTYDPNAKIDQNKQNPFEAAFAAHQPAPMDLKKMIREELYNRSITALPGEWAGSLPDHPSARERVDAWRRQILPEDLNERQYWDDLDYCSTKLLAITRRPIYSGDSPIGTLEQYRFNGRLMGELIDVLVEQPASWKEMLLLEAQTGATIKQDSERRQQEIRDTKEVQCCVT